MVSEYVEWLVACLPANWVLLLSVVVILVTFQWALRFALFIAAVLFVFGFRFSCFFFCCFCFYFCFLFSFGFFLLLPSFGRIYKCIWMVSACLSALFFPHFGWFYLIFMAFYIRIFARAFFVSEWFEAYESRTGCVCVDHYGALKDLLAEFICMNRAIWQWDCNGIMLSMCCFYSFWSGVANPNRYMLYCSCNFQHDVFFVLIFNLCLMGMHPHTTLHSQVASVNQLRHQRAMWEPHTVPNKSMSRADHPSTGNNFIQALKEIKMLQS